MQEAGYHRAHRDGDVLQDQDGEVVHEDERPVDLGEGVVEEPQEQDRQPAPEVLGAGHFVGAHLVHPNSVLDGGCLVEPISWEDFDPSVGLGHIQC